MDFLFSEGKRKELLYEVSSEKTGFLPGVHSSVLSFDLYYQQNRDKLEVPSSKQHPLDQDVLRSLSMRDEFYSAPEIRHVSFREFHETMCRLAYEVVNRCKIQKKELVLYLGEAEPYSTCVWSSLLVWPILRQVVRSVATKRHQNFPPADIEADIVYVDDLVPLSSNFRPIADKGRSIIVLAFGKEKESEKSYGSASESEDIQESSDEEEEEDDETEDGIPYIKLHNTDVLFYNQDLRTYGAREHYYFDHAIGSGLSEYFDFDDAITPEIFNIEGTEIPTFPPYLETIDFYFNGEVVKKGWEYGGHADVDVVDLFPPPLSKIDDPSGKSSRSD